MKKDSFIKATIILIIGGFITKILGMIIKIITNRLIGLEGLSLYMLVYPTLSLMMSISQFSLPTSISKLVSEERYNNKNLIFSSILIKFIFSLFLIIILIFSSSFIANNLLKNSNCYLPILAITIVIPFEAISNMLRGYLFGKRRMLPHVISHIIEQLVRLILTVLIIPSLVSKNIIYAVTFLVIVNMISEFTSIIVILLFLPKNIIIRKKDIIPTKNSIKSILNISIPNTSTRILGNIGYFLEPVLLTSALLKCGYSMKYITLNYGIITGYTMPLLLLPSFFTSAISSSLLPIISKAYINKNIIYIKKKIKEGIGLSLLIGIPITVFLFFFPDFFLKILYQTTSGTNYLKALAFPFLFYYIELPLSAILQATNKAKEVMLDNIIGIVLKTILIYLTSLLNIGLYSYVIAYSINTIIVSILHIIHIRKIII